MTTERAYRPDRFARAVKLVLSGRVERLGGGHYRVAGNDEPSYDVDLNGDPPCYCADQWHRGRAIKGQCKHSLAARLAGMEEWAVQLLADRIEREEQAAQEAKQSRRASRRRTPVDTERPNE